MTGTRRKSLGLAFAVLLLVGSWQALADSCGPAISGWHCGPVTTLAALSQDALFLTAAAHENEPSVARPASQAPATPFALVAGAQPFDAVPTQTTGLLLLGAGLALAGQSLKRRTLPAQAEARVVG